MDANNVVSLARGQHPPEQVLGKGNALEVSKLSDASMCFDTPREKLLTQQGSASTLCCCPGVKETLLEHVGLVSPCIAGVGSAVVSAGAELVGFPLWRVLYLYVCLKTLSGMPVPLCATLPTLLSCLLCVQPPVLTLSRTPQRV